MSSTIALSGAVSLGLSVRKSKNRCVFPIVLTNRLSFQSNPAFCSRVFVVSYIPLLNASDTPKSTSIVTG